MRLLFLTPRPLAERRSGGTIKSGALLDHLERRHDVDVATFVEAGEGWERERGSTMSVTLRRPRSVRRLLASYARRVPLSIERNRSDEMSESVEQLLAHGDHGAVFVDGWLMAQYLPSRFAGRTLLHQHNAEHVMWARQADLERIGPRRAVVRLEAARVRRYEAAIVRRFDVVFAVSQPDRTALLGIGAPPPVPLLPNVPEPSLMTRPPLAPIADPLVLTIGTLSWQPNVEGLVRFLREGLPELRRSVPGARLVVGGSGAPPSLAALVARTDGVELVGEVRDDEPLYGRARCFVDLGAGGAGTRVKLLNAFARGLPAVATRDAAEGLEVVPGEHLLVAEDARTLVPHLMRVLRDDETWRALSERARSLVRTTYIPEVAFRSLDEVLAAE